MRFPIRPKTHLVKAIHAVDAVMDVVDLGFAMGLVHTDTMVLEDLVLNSAASVRTFHSVDHHTTIIVEVNEEALASWLISSTLKQRNQAISILKPMFSIPSQAL